jgi:hypothetical protein
MVLLRKVQPLLSNPELKKNHFIHIEKAIQLHWRLKSMIMYTRTVSYLILFPLETVRAKKPLLGRRYHR